MINIISSEDEAIFMESTSTSPAETIPIMVDSVKRFDKFSLTRCTYFSIEAKEPGLSTMLQLSPPDVRLPLLLIDLSGVIMTPLGTERSRFESADDIDRLFEVIDQHPNYFVDTNDIWLPTSLLDSKHRRVARGMVYRIGEVLFRAAYILKDEIRSETDFYRQISIDDTPRHVEFSELETKALQSWQEQLISFMREAYHANPERQLAKKVDRSRPPPEPTLG